jgi:type IV pilus assembly protein PilV
MSDQQGFTLIEILIAIVIFSIGLLGIAGLQVAGMRFTHGSQLRSVAVLQAETMADLMRANEFAVREGEYNAATMPSSFPVDCAISVCTAQQRATYDLVTWNFTTAGLPREANQDVLPQGTGVVCRDATPNDGNSTDWACDNSGNVYAIKLQWLERTAGRNDSDADVVTENFVMTVLPALDEN